MQTEDIWSVLAAPLHVGPSLLAIWRGLDTVFPEWSLQLLHSPGASPRSVRLALGRPLAGKHSLSSTPGRSLFGEIQPAALRFPDLAHDVALGFHGSDDPGFAVACPKSDVPGSLRSCRGEEARDIGGL